MASGGVIAVGLVRSKVAGHHGQTLVSSPIFTGIKALCIIGEWESTGNLDPGYEMNFMALEAMPPIGQRAQGRAPSFMVLTFLAPTRFEFRNVVRPNRALPRASLEAQSFARRETEKRLRTSVNIVKRLSKTSRIIPKYVQPLDYDGTKGA